MLCTLCALQIDANRRERQPLRNAAFGCCAFYENIHAYLASQVPPHWHHEWELLQVESGEVEVTLAETQARLRTGEGYFVNTDKLHSVNCATEAPCQIRSLVFDPAILSGGVGSVFDVNYIRPLIQSGPPALVLRPEAQEQQSIFRAFEEAYAACVEEGYGYEFTVRSALSQIALALKQYAPDSARPSTLREEKLKQMIEWIDAHFSQPVTLRDLAGAIHFSPRECERVFQQLLHVTPKVYLLRRRVAAAAELLARGDLPIIEVAAQCGFSNHSYFSRQFRAVTGETPRGYRAKVQNPAEQAEAKRDCAAAPTACGERT